MIKKRGLRYLCAPLAILLILAVCSACAQTASSIPGSRLYENDGIGESYLQDLYFFGESTTAHLARTGGVLDTDAARQHVLRDASGTRMLDRRILESPVLLYGTDGEKTEVSFKHAIKILQPPVLVLSFGLNGIMRFSQDTAAFVELYRHLINGIRANSPDTVIILQSVYPVRCADRYSVDVKTLNERISALNTTIEDIAAQEQIQYINTAPLLCDADGLLASEYDSGDGIHLCDDAYRTILSYLSSHLSSRPLSASKGIENEPYFCMFSRMSDTPLRCFLFQNRQIQR